jgi:hypothetical protein
MFSASLRLRSGFFLLQGCIFLLSPGFIPAFFRLREAVRLPLDCLQIAGSITFVVEEMASLISPGRCPQSRFTMQE